MAVRPSFALFLGIGTVIVVATLTALRSPESRPLPFAVQLFVHGHDDAIQRGERRVPLFMAPRAPVGVCLELASDLDTSQWQGRLGFGPSSFAGPFESPTLRAAERQLQILCFDTVLPAASSEERELILCGQVRDAIDGAIYDLPCRPIIASARWPSAYRRIWDAAVLEVPAFEETLAWARLALDEDFPLLAIDALLLQIRNQRRIGDDEAASRIRQLVATLPSSILDQPEAVRQYAILAYELAVWELDQGLWASAWKSLERSARAARRSAVPLGASIASRQAEILSRVGAVPEATALLRATLDPPSGPTAPYLLAAAREQLVWLLLQDPDSGPEDLAEAERLLEAAVAAADPNEDPTETANRWINFGYLRLRQGVDPGPELERAEKQLAELPAEDQRSRRLARWANMVAASADLEAGDWNRALARCRPLTNVDDEARLAAWAASCRGRAQRARGDLAAAAVELERALVIHESAGPQRLGQLVPPSPGMRADDFLRAARVAVEHSRPEEAWRLLARLDRMAVLREERLRCLERSEGQVLQSLWRRHAERGRELQRQLLALDVPATAQRQLQLERQVLEVKRQLQEHARRLPGCGLIEGGESLETADLKAFMLVDEIIVLERTPEGVVSVVRRTRGDRRELLANIEALDLALRERVLEDGRWRRLAQPLAAALVPPRNPGPITRYALYGALQRVPVAALPRPGAGWWSDETLIAVSAAGALRPPGRPSERSRRPLFVVDPVSNLPTARELGSVYRDLFPEATVLFRAAATRSAFVAALAEASSLHLDSHGRYDDRFPELSSLELADGPLLLQELAAAVPPLELANLSGCHTGRWPVTADAGSYGFAGLLARRGAVWVVASRTYLADALARDFNRVLYARLSQGMTLPQAYGEALANLRRRAPAAAWAGLMLLAGSEHSANLLENSAVATPSEGERSPVRP
ncbi:MAG: CHAT domain-containing protein, partial [Acidobacteriota bacterium]